MNSRKFTLRIAVTLNFVALSLVWIDSANALNPHPRLFLTPERTTRMLNKVATGDPDFLRLKATADFYIATGKTADNIGVDNIGNILLVYAAMYKATGDAKYLAATLASMDIHCTKYRLGPNWPTQSMNVLVSPNSWGGLGNYSQTIMYMAVAYDWLYSELTNDYPDKKANYRVLLEEYGDSGIRKSNDGLSPPVPAVDPYTLFQGSAWTNYAFRWIQSIVAVGYALTEDSPQKSANYLAAARERYNELAPLLRSGSLGDGGGSFEGTFYGRHQDGFLKYVEMVWTATGEDLYTPSEAYFKARGYYLTYLYHWWDFGGGAYPFRLGDFTEYGRIDGFSYKDDPIIEIRMLMERYPIDVGADLEAVLSRYTKSIGIASTRGTTSGKDASVAYWDLLYYSPSIVPTSLSDVPLFFRADGTGETILRSNWTEKDGVALHFKSGNHNSYHEHVDQNSFQIAAFGGEFALHSGNYNQARDDEQINYALRTVSTNTILILDPAENFREIRGGDVYNNEGGQRGFPYSQSAGGPTPTDYNKVIDQYANVYGTGKTTNFETGPDHSFLIGDATNAYNNPLFISAAPDGKPQNNAKATRVERDLAFVKPSSANGESYIVILDRVNTPSARASLLKTKWLLHTMKKPVISGNPTQIQGTTSGGIWEYDSTNTPIQIDDGGGRLFIKPVFPQPGTSKIILTGGAGYEQWADGANHPPRRTRLKSALDGSALAGSIAYYGQWRIELQPISAQANNYFLNVLMPTRITTAAMPDTEALSSATGNAIGVCVKDAVRNRVVMFSADPNGQPPAGPISYSFTSSVNETMHHIFNLSPAAAYDVAVTNSANNQTVTIAIGTQHTASQAGSIKFSTTRITAPVIRIVE